MCKFLGFKNQKASKKTSGFVDLYRTFLDVKALLLQNFIKASWAADWYAVSVKILTIAWSHEILEPGNIFKKPKNKNAKTCSTPSKIKKFEIFMKLKNLIKRSTDGSVIILNESSSTKFVILTSKLLI